MPVEAILGAASFVGLFAAWVVVPSLLRKRHASRVEVSEDEKLV